MSVQPAGLHIVVARSGRQRGGHCRTHRPRTNRLQGHHVLTSLAVTQGLLVLVSLAGRWRIPASLPLWTLHEPAPYAPKTSTAGLSAYPLSLNVVPVRTIACETTRQASMATLNQSSAYGVPTNLPGGAMALFRAFDVRWTEGCCAGTRPWATHPPLAGWHGPG